MIKLPTPAKTPTMYFIGVTTAQSSIMRIFPVWTKALGIQGVIKGIDIPIHAEREQYRAVVEFIKNDPYSVGALVTTHKIDLYEACEDMFEYIDPYAKMFGELSSISKNGEKLCAHAKDPISSGLAMDAFIPEGHWLNHPSAQALILGAGGSALAISAYLADYKHKDNAPKRINITNRSYPRLSQAVRILSDSRAPMSFHLCKTPEMNDEIAASLPEGSLVVNATGLGKDRPGSPITSKCLFPKNGLVWELNYRGTLEFMRHAQAQASDRGLLVEDGWTYFIHGWTQVISEVFHTDIKGERLAVCDRLARS